MRAWIDLPPYVGGAFAEDRGVARRTVDHVAWRSCDKAEQRSTEDKEDKCKQLDVKI